MKFTPEDETYLRLTFALARKGVQTVSPNPAVGAVIVRDNRIIAEGWHLKAGEDHAEVNAIKNCSEQTSGATLYVNLEPCSHYGRTPPCTKAIIEAGFSRVVAAARDSNPKVNGKGFQSLADAGIEVSFGFLEDEARQINEVYFHYMEKQLPFVHIKAGMSLDGRIATSTGKSQWITSEEAREYAHRLRQRYDGILVGLNTLVTDNPRLDVRVNGGGWIHRIILDSKLNTPVTARIFDRDAGGQIFIATIEESENDRWKKLADLGAEIIVCKNNNGKVDLNDFMHHLAKKQVTSILVEGGGETIASFVRKKLVNKLTFVYAPLVIGGRKSIPVVGGVEIDELSNAIRFKSLRPFSLGPDIAIEAYPE